MYAGKFAILKLAKRALAQKVDVDAQDVSGMTALMYAAESHNNSAVKLLLESGANVSKRDFTGKSAIDYADPTIRATLEGAANRQNAIGP